MAYDAIRDREEQKARALNPLTSCAACKREISSNAASCPHCGEPMAKPKQTASGFLSALLIGLIIGWVLYMLITGGR